MLPLVSCRMLSLVVLGALVGFSFSTCRGTLRRPRTSAAEASEGDGAAGDAHAGAAEDTQAGRLPYNELAEVDRYLKIFRYVWLLIRAEPRHRREEIMHHICREVAEGLVVERIEASRRGEASPGGEIIQSLARISHSMASHSLLEEHPGDGEAQGPGGGTSW